mmetsp:Transcript_16195/g.44837  ORF Transcript_16195/g.44837 Transcript_16195/m.44837 type:complete len:238 (-) Transcript_16195:288-1001(-)|eukprot:CAMPEP_0172365368 /NCGR_PEP_ID=MMETSP1060-20121228/9256_1 /TAXON_ID=37318 /ORGANISM="Pseudo-nitzschia pungens, Strain cf. cingulata" /LENGTH=237 /DNA_ID=CAMNT_0013088625 /DNA_START=59 /DNA_END=772 /DNA_ORIENTATION=-
MPFLTATVVKEETSSKLGIAFERLAEDKAMTIKLIREDSLFAGSDLCEGLIVASAAGKDMEGMSPKDCADALRESPGGEEVSLVCKGSKVSIAKDSKKLFKKPPKIGISFKSTTAVPGKVFVSNIKEDSKFYGTDLAIGHQVLLINGEKCPGTVSEAVDLLTKKGVKEITLVTIDPEDEKVVPKAKEDPVEEVVEEKKEETDSGATPAAEPKEVTEDDLTPEGNKTILDTMFGVCMC